MPVKSKSHRRRPKSNPLSVTATGWAWLMIGVLLALFLGGAVRALLSERQVRQWIEKKWQQEDPPYFLKFQTARVELSEGWRPRFGLLVRGLELSPKDPCGRGHRLQISELFLPGPLSVLWGKSLRFGQVRASDLIVEKMPACAVGPAEIAGKAEVPSLSAASASLSAETALANERRQAEEFLRERWPLELQKTLKWISGVLLENVRVLGFHSPFNNLQIHRLELGLQKGSLDIANPSAAELNIEFSLIGPLGEALSNSRMQFQLKANSVQADARLYIPIREGHALTTVNMKLPDMSFDGQFNLAFLPATSVVEILRQTKVVTDPLSLKRSWLAGQGKLEGQLFEAVPIRRVVVENMKLSGDTGTVSVGSLDLQPKSNGISFQPFTVNLDHFSFRYLIEALGRKGYTGVVGDFGQLTGMLQVGSAEDVSFRGEVENLTLNFSSQNVRASQKINFFRTALELKKGRVSGLIRDFEFDQGAFAGLVSFNMDRNVLNGMFQIKVDQLSFSPSVQKLMVGGELSPIAIYGQGQMREGQVSQWSGEIGTKQIKAADWQVDTLKIRSEFAAQQMILQAKANGLILRDGQDLRRRLQPVLQKYSKLQPDLSLQHLSARLEISNQSVKWRNASASIGGGEVMFATVGQSEHSQLAGQLSVDLPGAKMVRWALSGPWDALVFSPLGK